MYDAIVLAGGAASRLGGADKPSLRVAGVSLLDRVLDAVADAERIVVVGPPADRRATEPRRGRPELTWRREDPPGSGPVAALAAGVDAITGDVVVVLAADLPWIAGAVPVLCSALGRPAADVAVLVDGAGRLNYLAAAWRTDALRRALAAAGGVAGVPVRALFRDAEVVDVPDVGGWGTDCDTWDDLDGARRRAEQRSIT